MKLFIASLLSVLAGSLLAESTIPFGQVLDREGISVCLIQHGDLPPFIPQVPVALRNYSVIASITASDPAVDEYRVAATIETSDGQRRIYYESAKRTPQFTIILFQLGKTRATSIVSLEIVPLQKGQAKTF